MFHQGFTSDVPEDLARVFHQAIRHQRHICVLTWSRRYLHPDLARTVRGWPHWRGSKLYSSYGLKLYLQGLNLDGVFENQYVRAERVLLVRDPVRKETLYAHPKYQSPAHVQLQLRNTSPGVYLKINYPGSDWFYYGFSDRRTACEVCDTLGYEISHIKG